MLVNGQEFNKDNISVTMLLADLGHDATRVAVEKNGTIISHKAFDTEMLVADDRIEIVHFVGGG
jgi:thiamine biosynthesis protein ThiS